MRNNTSIMKLVALLKNEAFLYIYMYKLYLSLSGNKDQSKYT
jgi:hypothetical protein